MIEVNELTKRYGDHTAVDGVSFSVEKGQVLGFLGPNGAGKTTTMRMIVGFLSPTSGSVSIDGHDLFEKPIVCKQNIGYLPENPPLYLDMTVNSYLTYVGKLRNLSSSDTKDRVSWAIEKCLLEDVRGRLIGNLSKGYKQRVGIAQAILHRPQVLILDEPTIGLDPRQIRAIRSLIRELADNHTLILSSHILSEVTMTCNRLLIINRGRVIRQGTIDEVSDGKPLEETFVSLISSDSSEEHVASTGAES